METPGRSFNAEQNVDSDDSRTTVCGTFSDISPVEMSLNDQDACPKRKKSKMLPSRLSVSTFSTSLLSFSSTDDESEGDIEDRDDTSYRSSQTSSSSRDALPLYDIEMTPPPKWINVSSLETEQQGVGKTAPLLKLPDETMVLFGVDISHFSPTIQFLLCCSGVFTFTIMYGYLQELLTVHIAGRKFALFLATCQFAGYALWSFALTKLRIRSAKNNYEPTEEQQMMIDTAQGNQMVPIKLYVGLSILRALDLGTTNLAMQFLNYPAKTLIKSSRVLFTMIVGVLFGWKKYKTRDYMIVGLLMVGLAIFLHADSKSDALFHPVGVLLLVCSLISDGVVQNGSELVMNKYSVGQDEFLFRLSSVAFVAMASAAYLKGDLILGIKAFFLTAGTVPEIESSDYSETSWTVPRKIIVLVLFCTSGLFGSSCAAAMTKRFGALTMSIMGTTRKATTLFLSYAIFPNHCTAEHMVGMVTFLAALVYKAAFSSTNKASDKKRRSSDADVACESLEENKRSPHFEVVPLLTNDGVQTGIFDIVSPTSTTHRRK